jgi:hypothetical protein
MEWVSDVGEGEWVRERLGDGDAPGLRWLVPDGFEACVRVFHPFTRRRSAEGEVVEEVEWRVVAGVFGTVMAPDAVAFRLLGGDDHWDHDEVAGPDGWLYGRPEEGSAPAGLLARIAEVAAAHTTTPDNVIAGIWEGWGGLVAGGGVFHVRFWDGPFGWLPTMLDSLVSRAKSRLTARALSRPGSGLLPKEVAVGPRLELPLQRLLILFRSPLADYAGGRWREAAPWTDSDFRWDQTPTALWPADHAWYLATEIDFDTTLVAGSQALADALIAAKGIEAARVSRDAVFWG